MVSDYADFTFIKSGSSDHVGKGSFKSIFVSRIHSDLDDRLQLAPFDHLFNLEKNHKYDLITRPGLVLGLQLCKNSISVH